MACGGLLNTRCRFSDIRVLPWSALAKQGKSYIIRYGLTRGTRASLGYSIAPHNGGFMADELADELYEKGIAIREEMLGPEHGRAKVESQPDFTRDFE